MWEFTVPDRQLLRFELARVPPQPSASDHNAVIPGRVPHVRRLRRTWVEDEVFPMFLVSGVRTFEGLRPIVFGPRTLVRTWGTAGSNSKCNIQFFLIYSFSAAGAVGKLEAQFASYFSMAHPCSVLGQRKRFVGVGPILCEVEGTFRQKQLSRSFPTQAFPYPDVELPGESVQVFLGIHR